MMHIMRLKVRHVDAYNDDANKYMASQNVLKPYVLKYRKHLKQISLSKYFIIAKN